MKLSEQQIIDCSTSNNGCNGGFVYYALEYVKNKGLETFSSYPYRANVIYKLNLLLLFIFMKPFLRFIQFLTVSNQIVNIQRIKLSQKYLKSKQ